MQTGENQGSITVFLAVTFLFIMAMLGTLIDGARLVEANAQAYYAADLAAASALGQFRYDLKDRYGLFAYEDDPKDVIQQIALENLSVLNNEKMSASEQAYEQAYNSVLGTLGIEDPSRSAPFDLLQFRNVQASQAGIPITLSDPDEFERQIFEYVKFRGAVELFQEDLTLDFSEIPGEMEKAKNEELVDKSMDDLQEELADHYDLQGKYNEELRAFKEKLKDIKHDKYDPIVKKLENEAASMDGLTSLKGKMGSLSGALSIEADCNRLLSLIHDLEQSKDKIIESANQMSRRFSGTGDTATFDNNKKISGEMLSVYQEDLEGICQKAELLWENGSTTQKEKDKYRRIRNTVKSIHTEISNYTKRIVELEEEEENGGGSGGEDEDDEHESLGERVEKLWKNLKSHFNGVLYKGKETGVFTDTSALQFLKSPETRNETEEKKVREWTEQAENATEEDQRDYCKAIPGDYALPGNLTQEQVTEKLRVELQSGFSEGMSRDEVSELRTDNRTSADDIKNLFSGVGELTLDTLDNAMLGLYAMGNFQNTLCFETEPPSDYHHEQVDTSKYSLNMRNDVIEDSSIFFDDCEIEYLIGGHKEEQKNYQGIRNELTGLYFTLNYARIRKVAAIRGNVEGVAKAVKAAVIGATFGLGAGASVIAYYATREACYLALAIIQTNHDL